MFVAETMICWVISKNQPIWEFEQPVSAKKGYTIGKPSSRQLRLDLLQVASQLLPSHVLLALLKPSKGGA